MRNTRWSCALVAVIMLLTSVGVIAQEGDSTVVDTTKIKVAHASKFGLNFGFDYSLWSIRANPYFLENADGMGEAEIVNSGGMNIGLFWHEPLREKSSLRFAIEATIMPNKIEYNTGNPRRDQSMVYPLTVELPVAFIFGRHFRYDVEAKSLFKTGVLAGLRPVIPLSLFNSSQPVVKAFNLNIDIGITRPIALKNSIMRSELLFSYGLFNLISKDELNYKTSSIAFLGRNFIALRFFFN